MLITVANVHVYWLFIGVVGNSKCNKQRVYEGERKSWLNTCVICCIFPSETKYLSRQYYFSGISYLTLLKRRVSYCISLFKKILFGMGEDFCKCAIFNSSMEDGKFKLELHFLEGVEKHLFKFMYT